jgi:hypothetical protein
VFLERTERIHLELNQVQIIPLIQDVQSSMKGKHPKNKHRERTDLEEGPEVV